VANPAFFLDDPIGNVGIVVGAQGRVQDEDQDGVLDASTGGFNGSLSGITAQNIMSAVAGSVDRIASIRSITNINLPGIGAIYGANKSFDSQGRIMSGDGVLYDSQTAELDYLKANDDHTIDPEGAGKLVDGAIIGENIRPLLSIRDFRKAL
jgi:hypothetical protein